MKEIDKEKKGKASKLLKLPMHKINSSLKKSKEFYKLVEHINKYTDKEFIDNAKLILMGWQM